MGLRLAGAILVVGFLASSCSGTSSDGGPSNSAAIATWELLEGPAVTEEGVEITVGVTRLECANGKTGEVLTPEVGVEGDMVVVRTPVAVLPKGGRDCQGNDSVPVEILLPSEAEGKDIYDYECLQGREASSTTYCTDGGKRYSSSSSG